MKKEIYQILYENDLHFALNLNLVFKLRLDNFYAQFKRNYSIKVHSGVNCRVSRFWLM